MKKVKTFLHLLVLTFKNWSNDQVSHLAAALSYYTIFSLAPILIICIAIAGFAFGADIVSTRVLHQIGNALGGESALEIQMLIDNIRKPSTNILASILGGLTLLWGCLGLFSELQNCFNVIWKVKPKENRSWLDIIKQRFFSFTIVLGVSFVLLVSLLF